MSILEIWLLAFALAVDCFAVCIASGIAWRSIAWRYVLATAFCFGVFQGGMPLLGWLGMSVAAGLIEQVDHWVAFLLLAFVGGKMVREGLHPSEEQGLDPRCWWMMLVLGVATSIDALAVGITFRCVGWTEWAHVLEPSAIIALVAFVMSIIGFKLGSAIGRKIGAGRMEIFGGVVLIGIGLKVLLEHTLAV
ncbi:MAG: manganese efflux pump [Bacteroidaceae bacterium]|nr:manganese efflux pump [Bacteroidaceae bacterium]